MSKYTAIEATPIKLADIVDVEASTNGFKPALKVATKWLIPGKVPAEVEILYADSTSKSISSKDDIAEVYRLKLLPSEIKKDAAKASDYIFRYCVTAVRRKMVWLMSHIPVALATEL